MKVIFLDFDGVLNSTIYDRTRDLTKNTSIDETRLPLLKQIVDRTNAKIVLSTSWRRHWSPNIALCDDVGLWINKLFSSHGLEIYDKTPHLHFGAGRKNEILDWLKYSIEPVESYVILDDYAFGWEDLSDKLVKTSPTIGLGLEQEHIEKCIFILNNNL